MRENIKMNREDYTVLLMLKDRFPFTKRWLNYMAAIKFPYKIFIADGSCDDQAKDYLEQNAAKFKDLDIDYVRYPHDKNYSVYYKKIADSLGRIKTRYVSVSDNDDFYIVDGISKSIDFLDRHKDYSSCRGEISSIAVYASNKKPENKYLYGRSGGIVYKYYYGESIENAKSSDRVLCHASKYDPTFYDVHRTDHLRMCFEKLLDIDPENLYIAEFLTSYLTVASGKVKRLRCMYYVRQTNAPGSSNAAEAKRFDFFERMLLPTWSHDYCGSAEAVARIISEKDAIEHDEAIRVFMKAYKIHSGPNVIWSVTHESEMPLTVISRALRKLSHYKTKVVQSYSWRSIIDRFGKSREYFAALRPVVDFLLEKHK